MITFFIICPFFAFLSSLRDLTKTSNGIVFVLFFALFGYCMTFELTTADSYRCALGFYTAEDGESLKDIVSRYREGNITDIYRYAMYSFCSSFTKNPKVLFAGFGFVFGLFCYLSVKMLLKERTGKKDKYLALLVIVFFCFNSIVNINGIRFWTATWMFFYFLAQYFVHHNKKALLGLMAVPLVHFGYIMLVIFVLGLQAVIFLLYFKELSRKFLFILFVLCFFSSFVLPQTSIQDTMGDDVMESSPAINRKYESYTNMEESREKDRGGGTYEQSNKLFAQYSKYSSKIMAFILCFTIYFKWPTLRKMQTTTILFSLVLALFCFSFLASSLMHSGGRFIVVSWLFLVYLLFRIYDENRKKIWQQWIISLIPTVSAYYIVFVIFNGVRFVTPLLWFANLPYLIFTGLGFGKELLSY